MWRERHGRRQDLVERRGPAFGERRERGAGRRRDRIEDAEQGIAVALAVAGDQLGIVEVVAGVHAHARGQAGPQHDLLFLVEQRQLDAVDLGDVALDDPDADVHGGHVVGAAEIALERRVEHLAQPVDDARRAQLGENAVVHPDLVVRGARAGGKRAAGHEHDAPAHPLDRGDLLLVGADHVVDGEPGRWRQVVGAGAAEDDGPGRDRAASRLRRISSCEAFQSRPMPRCAVSIASATPSPRSHKRSRYAMVRSQSIATSSHGSTSASGSATTCAAASATRLNGPLAHGRKFLWARPAGTRRDGRPRTAA